jgi:hypothetical protein
MSSILFAETSGTLSTNSSNWTNIPGLHFTLPPFSPGQTHALLMLNLPNPYASGNDFPGAYIGIAVNGSVLVPVGCFTAESKTPQSWGRKPVTLVVQVALLHNNTQAINAVWQSVRSSNVIIDTPASLSAIIS